MRDTGPTGARPTAPSRPSPPPGRPIPRESPRPTPPPAHRGPYNAGTAGRPVPPAQERRGAVYHPTPPAPGTSQKGKADQQHLHQYLAEYRRRTGRSLLNEFNMADAARAANMGALPSVFRRGAQVADGIISQSALPAVEDQRGTLLSGLPAVEDQRAGFNYPQFGDQQHLLSPIEATIGESPAKMLSRTQQQANLQRREHSSGPDALNTYAGLVGGQIMGMGPSTIGDVLHGRWGAIPRDAMNAANPLPVGKGIAAATAKLPIENLKPAKNPFHPSDPFGVNDALAAGDVPTAQQRLAEARQHGATANNMIAASDLPRYLAGLKKNGWAMEADQIEQAIRNHQPIPFTDWDLLRMNYFTRQGGLFGFANDAFANAGALAAMPFGLQSLGGNLIDLAHGNATPLKQTVSNMAQDTVNVLTNPDYAVRRPIDFASFFIPVAKGADTAAGLGMRALRRGEWLAPGERVVTDIAGHPGESVNLGQRATAPVQRLGQITHERWVQENRPTIDFRRWTSPTGAPEAAGKFGLTKSRGAGDKAIGREGGAQATRIAQQQMALANHLQRGVQKAARRLSEPERTALLNSQGLRPVDIAETMRRRAAGFRAGGGVNGETFAQLLEAKAKVFDGLQKPYDRVFGTPRGDAFLNALRDAEQVNKETWARLGVKTHDLWRDVWHDDPRLHDVLAVIKQEAETKYAALKTEQRGYQSTSNQSSWAATRMENSANIASKRHTARRETQALRRQSQLDAEVATRARQATYFRRQAVDVGEQHAWRGLETRTRPLERRVDSHLTEYKNAAAKSRQAEAAIGKAKSDAARQAAIERVQLWEIRAASHASRARRLTEVVDQAYAQHMAGQPNLHPHFAAEHARVTGELEKAQWRAGLYARARESVFGSGRLREPSIHMPDTRRAIVDAKKLEKAANVLAAKAADVADQTHVDRILELRAQARGLRDFAARNKGTPSELRARAGGEREKAAAAQAKIAEMQHHFAQLQTDVQTAEEIATERRKQQIEQSGRAPVVYVRHTTSEKPTGLRGDKGPSMPRATSQSIGFRDRTRNYTLNDHGQRAYTASVPLSDLSQPTVAETIPKVLHANASEEIALGPGETHHYDVRQYKAYRLDYGAPDRQAHLAGVDNAVKVLGHEAELGGFSFDPETVSALFQDQLKGPAVNDGELVGSRDGEGHWVLIDRQRAAGMEDALARQHPVRGNTSRALRMVNKGLRTSMLYGQPATGIRNIVGTYAESFMGGAGPISVIRGLIRRYRDAVPVELRHRGVAENLTGRISHPTSLMNDRLGLPSTGVRAYANPVHAAATIMDVFRTMSAYGEDAARCSLWLRHAFATAKRDQYGTVGRFFHLANAETLKIIHQLAEGKHPESQRLTTLVEDFVGDMGKRGRLDTSVESSVLFHRWYQHIIKLTLVTMPLKYSKRNAVMYAIAAEGERYRKRKGLYPVWMRGSVIITDLMGALGVPSGGQQWVADTQAALPHGTMGQLFSANAEGTRPDLSGIAGVVSPAITLPWSAFASHDVTQLDQSNDGTGGTWRDHNGKVIHVGSAAWLRAFGQQLERLVPALGMVDPFAGKTADSLAILGPSWHRQQTFNHVPLTPAQSVPYSGQYVPPALRIPLSLVGVRPRLQPISNEAARIRFARDAKTFYKDSRP